MALRRVNPGAVERGTVYVAEYDEDDIRKLTPPSVLAASSLTGTSDQLASTTLTGLLPNTTYYDRVVATDSGGDTYGAIQSFTTPALIFPTVTTQPASAVTATSATLQGSVNPNGADMRANFLSRFCSPRTPPDCSIETERFSRENKGFASLRYSPDCVAVSTTKALAIGQCDPLFFRHFLTKFSECVNPGGWRTCSSRECCSSLHVWKSRWPEKNGLHYHLVGIR